MIGAVCLLAGVHECALVQQYYGSQRGISGEAGLSWCRISWPNASYTAAGY